MEFNPPAAGGTHIPLIDLGDEDDDDNRTDTTTTTTTSTKFLSEVTSNAMLAQRKQDPWASVIPIDRLVLTQFEAAATAAKVPPFKLLTVGRNLLEYVI